MAGIIEDLLDNYDKQATTIARFAEENQQLKQERELLVASKTLLKSRLLKYEPLFKEDEL